MPSFASLGKFFGRTASEGAAFAAGVAVAPALSPVVREIVNEANSKYQTHPIDANAAAAIVAEDVEQLPFGITEASYNGVSEERFRALLGETLNAPGVPLLLTLWRRDEISDADFIHGLRKAKLEGRWDAPLSELRTERLDPAIIATAIQRGVMQAPFDLPYDPTAGAGNVKPFPVSPLDTGAEALASGIDTERLRVETALVGLPMALDRAARAYFRNIINDQDYLRAVLEGNARGEWAAAELEVARQITTAHDGIEARLRGWVDDAGMYAQTERHGMSKEDTDLLFKINGRPPSWHQVWIGLQRGGIYDGPTTDIDPAFLKSLEESNLRPEWYNLLWRSRYTYPSTFILRTMTEAGDITEAEAEQILQFEGWEPTLRAKVAKRWAQTTTGTSAGPSKKAETSLLTALHKAYVDDRETETQARDALTYLRVADDEQTRTLETWNRERAIVRAGLTPTQIKKAVGQPGRDQAWALERLAELGYTQADAETFLAE